MLRHEHAGKDITEELIACSMLDAYCHGFQEAWYMLHICAAFALTCLRRLLSGSHCDSQNPGMIVVLLLRHILHEKTD